MRRLRYTLIALAGMSCLALGMQSVDKKPDAPQNAKPDWSAALTKLDPVRPRAYFELAEDIADAASTPQDIELARQLFGLAGTLARDEFARSSALALAALADDQRRKRSLLALAVLLTSDSNNAGDVVVFDASEQRPSVAAAVALSEAFSFYRRGQGTRAISAVKNAEVEALLNRFGSGLPGGADRFREDCRAYKGVRPEPPRAARISMLTIEESVLSAAGGDDRTKSREWSSLLLETSSRPFVEVDASRLDEAFGVDPTRPYWRDGRWLAEK